MGSGTHVKIWDYETLAFEANFMAFGSTTNSSGQVIDNFFSGGVRVGLGMPIAMDSSIWSPVQALAGKPNLKGFGGLHLDLLLSYFAGNPDDEDGVFVA